MDNKKSKEKNILAQMAEYQAIQNSAEHHDILLWTTASIVTGSLGFLSYQIFIENLTNNQNLGISLFSIIFISCAYSLLESFRAYKNFKYKLCKNIEKKISKTVKDFECQHLNLDKEMIKISNKFFAGNNVIYYILLIFLGLFITKFVTCLQNMFNSSIVTTITTLGVFIILIYIPFKWMELQKTIKIQKEFIQDKI